MIVEQWIKSVIVLESGNGVIRITNNSNMDMIVSLKPIPPKRKYLDVDIIKKGTSLIQDGTLRLERIAISFVKPTD